MVEKIKNEMAGEITLSATPGSTMKKWREIFAITQVELAELLRISPSTISDYEGNRRKSPGSGVIKRFVGAIIGGLVSTPGAVLGALLVGQMESFAAFYDSTFKDAVVFAALVPILVLRSALGRPAEDDGEEEEL